MTQDATWPLPALAEALGVPAEAFRAFARLRGIAWEARLPAADAASLALGWLAVDGGGASGPIADAASALLDAVSTAPSP